MQQNKKQTDPHLNTPSEANREKHINFREVEEDSSGNFMIDKTSTDRQKQWKQEIEEGEKDRQNSGDTNS